MEQAGARRSTVVVSVLILSLVYVLAMSRPPRAHATGKTTKADRPGDVPYTPTRLEWAAVEMQANYGSAWTNENPVVITYKAASDGTTIRCVLQYAPNVSAQAVKTSRDVAQVIFDRYATSRGWPWLRLRFEEMTLPTSH